VTERYELGTTASVRRALVERLPADVAAAAIEFLTGPLLDSPRRIGKALSQELAGVYSARLARDWRILYEIEEAKRVVVVLDIRHRSIAYRSR
jgi:mRNA interferase RelE/StbE